MKTKFWTFSQINSGGSFDYQPNDGITHYVIIEATSAIHAMQRAMDIGLYFNGCESGMDCSCCGDRWSEPYGDGKEIPSVYGDPAETYVNKYGFGMYSLFKKGEICIHYLDGRKKWHAKPSKVAA